MDRAKLILPFLIAVTCLGLGIEAQAAVTGEADFVAATLTGSEIGGWVRGLTPTPKSIGIFSVRAAAPLNPEYANVIETEVFKNLQSIGSLKVESCLECRTPKVSVRGDRLVVTKGAPSIEAMRELSKKAGVESFLMIEVYRTKLAVITQATLYEAGSGNVLAADHFKVPAIEIADSAMQFMLEAGTGFSFGGGNSSGGSGNPPISANLMVLEEIGIGKAGLNVGGIFGSSNSVLYLQPTLGWRGRWGASGLWTLFSVGAGFGASNGTYGVDAGLAYQVFLGSFTVIGLQATNLFPLQKNNTENLMTGMFSVNIGFSLGR